MRLQLGDHPVKTTAAIGRKLRAGLWPDKVSRTDGFLLIVLTRSARRLTRG
jgi:hypothetical protein